MSLNVRMNEGELSALRSAYELNIKDNTDKGRAQLQSGSQIPFEGWPESLVSRYLQVTLEPGETTLHNIHERVITPMQKIAEKLRITGVFPEHGDLPPHITFTRADFSKSSEGEIEAVLEKLSGNSDMANLRAFLAGSELPMDTFVAANTSYICASAPSIAVLGVRKGINQLVSEAVSPDSGVTIVTYNIAQVSSMRVGGSIRPDVGRAFLDETHEKIGRHLISDPLVFKTNRTFVGRASDHIRGGNPSLLK